MDATGLLAKHTHDLVGEICNYIKHGKLLQTAVLLLAAQEHIRGGCSCKRNGNSNQDGFGDIIKYISEHTSAIKLDVDGKEHAQLKEKYISSTIWLVQAISRAGKALGECIENHSKVPDLVDCICIFLCFFFPNISASFIFIFCLPHPPTKKKTVQSCAPYGGP